MIVVHLSEDHLQEILDTADNQMEAQTELYNCECGEYYDGRFYIRDKYHSRA